MNFDYSKATVAQGRDNQQKIAEQPNTFGQSGGATALTQTTQLDKPKQRMAGRVGQRALDFMKDPKEQKRTNKWLKAFGMSNQGAEFNIAKMNGDSAWDYRQQQ